MYIYKPRASKWQLKGHVRELNNYGLPLKMHCSCMYLTWINAANLSQASICVSVLFLFSCKSVNIGSVIIVSRHFTCKLYFPLSLTNEESRKNWEEHGNPDGPGGRTAN